MKIINLQAENVKRLVAVEIKPDGNLVEISGKNGQGKTSVLDALWWALAGAGNVQAAPIRRGANKATIRLDLGEIVVTRKFATVKEKEAESFTTSITVENADGARFPSPQALLDGLLGSLAFDPLEFARMKPREQFDALRKFVPGVDFDGIERAQKGDFERRTEINRQAKAARASADAMSVRADLPTAPIDTVTLMTKITDAAKVNAEIETRKGRRESTQRDANALKDAGIALRERSAKLREDAASADRQASAKLEEAGALEKKIDDAPELPEPVNVDSIRAKLDEALVVNDGIKQRAGKLAHSVEAERLAGEAEKLTKAMADRETAKQAAIAKADLPVPGISFGTGELLLNGLPFEQASDAERLRTSVAIAAAANPKLRVIRIRDGSLLDEDGMKLLAELADKADMQIWIERIGSGKVGFVIEDGRIGGGK